MNKTADNTENETVDNTALSQKVLRGHQRQVMLSYQLARVGYNTALGKCLRLQAYYRDALVMLRAWRDFLSIRQSHLGNTFFAVDQAILHTDHETVKQLMQVEPQIRGNDLGIIRILAPSYLLNNPLSLGMNGSTHTGARAIFQQALPNPFEKTEILGNHVKRFLSTATAQGQLHIGDDLPRFMLDILHQLVFDISLSTAEITASRNYIQGLPLASLPNIISSQLLRFKTGNNIRHRRQLTQQYQTSSRWATYLEAGKPYQLNPAQISNTLFDMIHIAGTAGTSALLGSVIGVLCQKDSLRSQIITEVNAVWANAEGLTGAVLSQPILLHNTILETARLYPPVRFVSQLATEAGEVEVGQQKCPFQQGTRLLGSIFTANRDDNRYQNPDDFSTQREFSDLLSWNGYEHERTCPGRSLSIELIKIFCLYLLKYYQWEKATEVKWDFEKVTAVTPNDLILRGFSEKLR